MAAIRSLLFVPGDSERKIAKGLASSADALALDLEDSVSPADRPRARLLCLTTLIDNAENKKIFVRINPLGTPDALLDLAVIVRGRPYGVMLPKCRDASDVERIDNYLSALEARDEVPVGQTLVLPIVTETASATFGLSSYSQQTPRLAGLLWGGEDLAADIGAQANRDAVGRYTPTYELVRSSCLLAATAARTDAIDAVYTDFRDNAGLQTEAAAAARDGFTAKAAIHPDQVDIINNAFVPTTEQVEHARQVIAAFDAAGGGVATLNGQMLDQPHRLVAMRLLNRTN